MLALFLFLMPPQAPPVAAVQQAPPMVLTYADAYAQAERTGQRLVVFVDAPTRDIKGVVTVRVPHEGHWLKFRSPSIVVYRENDLVLLGNVALTAPDSEIRDGGRKVVSQPAASPFRTVRPDDAGKPPVGWPKSIQWIPEAPRSAA